MLSDLSGVKPVKNLAKLSDNVYQTAFADHLPKHPQVFGSSPH